MTLPNAVDSSNVQIQAQPLYTVTIPETRLHQGDDGTYTEYKIQVLDNTTQKVINVYKRYNHFYELYKKLTKKYCELSSAVQFPSSTWFYKFDPSVIDHRQKTLEKFLQLLVTESSYQKEQLVLDFLNITLEKKKEESSRIMSKYPDKIPIICDPHPKSKMPIHKNKFLVPTTLTVGQFGYVIGKRLNTNADIIIYTPKEVVLGREMELSEVYEKHKHEDGFLYLIYLEQATKRM